MNEDTRPKPEAWSPRMKLVLIRFSLVGGFFLVAEHRAHLLPYLPWLFLAACPLMHLFGHGGHSHGSHSGKASNADLTAHGSAKNSPDGRETTAANGKQFRGPDGPERTVSSDGHDRGGGQS